MPIININGIRVAYLDDGTGLPIIFIPGLTGASDWFAYQFNGLDRSYRIISYEVRQTSRWDRYSIECLTEDLARMLDALKLDSVVIAGHSFGGMIAQRFAATHHQRVEALILISSFTKSPEEPREKLIEFMAPGGEVRAESHLETLWRQMFRLGPKNQEDGEDRTWLIAHSSKLSRATLDMRIKLVQKFDSTPWLPQIEVPTLIIVGADDAEPFLSEAQLLYETLPDSDLEVIENGDHFCFYNRHDLVNSRIDEFLRERVSGK